MSHEYRVTWSIDIDAPNPLIAALKAMEAVADPTSIAHIFEVAVGDRTVATIDLDSTPLLREKVAAAIASVQQKGTP